MPLTAGTRIGQYEILGAIGAGGMGEVYRARDAKLNRDVAIKVLPDRLAVDVAALARFEREAQAVAALSHPNILAIHDFGTSAGVTYAVMELLEGETLRARLEHGALPVRKAVDYGVHIARGIAAAQERGIVHRDLKPENIFITKAGVVKILDFGLAKATAGSGAAASAGETKVSSDTTPGTVMGTVGYMSPEQVRGLPIDHRTDIFSFGAILYEMLAGRRAFRGDSQVETMNAILKEDPPEFSEVGPSVPGSLERIIRRCLDKQPGDRFHSAHDLAISLEAVSGASGSASSAAVSARLLPAPRRAIRPLIAAAAVVVAGAGAFVAGRAWSVPEPASAPEMTRLTYRRGPIWSGQITPDGSTFLYSASWSATAKQVYSTRAESPESQSADYADADVVSVSAKGELALVSRRRNLAHFAQVGTLSRGPMSGGASRDVLEDVQDADWLPDASGFAVSHLVDGRYQLEFPIGHVVYQTGGWISHLRVSPDGLRVAFLDQPIVGDDRGTAAVIDASGKKTSMAVSCESTQGISWTPSGQEVWFTCSTKGLAKALLAGSLDGRVRTVLRVPGSLFLLDIAADGTVLLSHDNARFGLMGLPPGETTERDLSWLDWGQGVMLSEDGRKVLFTEEADGGGSGYSTFLRKTDGSPAIRLGSGQALALSPDGRWVISQNIAVTPAQLLLVPTGAGQSRALTNDNITHTIARFLPDGKRFIFFGFMPGRPPRTWVQSLDGGEPTPILPENITPSTAISPDGKLIVARDLDDQRWIYPTDGRGAAPQAIKGVDPTEGIIRFATDSRSLLIRKRIEQGAIQVFRVDTATGARVLVRTITPLPEAISAGGVGHLLITADGSSYVYGYGVLQSELFLVKGLR